MRALVDMTESQVEALDSLAVKMKRSRAALIRSAIDDYLERYHRSHVEDGFGLWADRPLDGMAYQDKVRGEW